ncbi:P-loop containing nucleoside triphosphate hydrolase protein [Melampsora americana]|nr:P-loop containing nucleoside triphosphate hydrolase protein [Melampsora americana]
MTTSIPSNLSPIVMFGPSGTGKSTLLKRLQSTPEWSQFGFSVSHTTREAREGEENGISYHFIQPDEFHRLIDQGEFIEYAQFSGNFYGTSLKAVSDVSIKERKSCILDIDAQGVKLIKSNHSNLNPFIIFISPPSLNSLKDRLSKRGTETEESLNSRLSMAKSEIEYASTGVPDVIIVNDDLDRAFEKFFKACVNRDRSITDSIPIDLLTSNST